jgi:predicted RNA-binding Zn ribbon-like protein
MMADQETQRSGPGLAGSLVEPRLCLDFANTVGTHDGSSPYDYLASYADLITWGCGAGVLTEHEATALRQAGERRPVDAAATLRDALALREAIYRLFSQRIDGAAPWMPILPP